MHIEEELREEKLEAQGRDSARAIGPESLEGVPARRPSALNCRNSSSIFVAIDTWCFKLCLTGNTPCLSDCCHSRKMQKKKELAWGTKLCSKHCLMMIVMNSKEGKDLFRKSIICYQIYSPIYSQLVLPCHIAKNVRDTVKEAI